MAITPASARLRVGVGRNSETHSTSRPPRKEPRYSEWYHDQRLAMSLCLIHPVTTWRYNGETVDQRTFPTQGLAGLSTTLARLAVGRRTFKLMAKRLRSAKGSRGAIRKRVRYFFHLVAIWSRTAAGYESTAICCCESVRSKMVRTRNETLLQRVKTDRRTGRLCGDC